MISNVSRFFVKKFQCQKFLLVCTFINYQSSWDIRRELIKIEISNVKLSRVNLKKIKVDISFSTSLSLNKFQTQEWMMKIYWIKTLQQTEQTTTSQWNGDGVAKVLDKVIYSWLPNSRNWQKTISLWCLMPLTWHTLCILRQVKSVNSMYQIRYIRLW